MGVTMYGPAFDGSGKLVQREVPDVDLSAYTAAGYKRGALPPQPESQKAESVATEDVGDDSENGNEPKRGKLPDDFPHVDLLRAAGVTTYAKARALKGDYSSIEGIAEARGTEINEAL